MKTKLILLAVICALLPMMWCGAKENDKSEDSSRFMSRMLDINTTAASTSGDRSAAQCSPSQQTVQPQQSAPQQSYQPADTLRSIRHTIEEIEEKDYQYFPILEYVNGEPYQPAGEKVGDIVYHNGVPGIVVFVCYDELGLQHGLLMSLAEGHGTWDNARAWCYNLGAGWRLPVLTELQMINNERKNINSALQSKGYTEIEASEPYWSDEEYDSANARCVIMWYGAVGCGSKNEYVYVRAVSAF